MEDVKRQKGRNKKMPRAGQAWLWTQSFTAVCLGDHDGLLWSKHCMMTRITVVKKTDLGDWSELGQC